MFNTQPTGTVISRRGHCSHSFCQVVIVRQCSSFVLVGLSSSWQYAVIAWKSKIGFCICAKVSVVGSMVYLRSQPVLRCSRVCHFLLSFLSVLMLFSTVCFCLRPPVPPPPPLSLLPPFSLSESFCLCLSVCFCLSVTFCLYFSVSVCLLQYLSPSPFFLSLSLFLSLSFTPPPPPPLIFL